jgi:glyoxylase I family protein
MISSIHHVSLLISSEKCLRFYKILGFEEVYRKSRKVDTVVLLEGFGIQLEIFIDPRHPKRNVDISEPLGTRHFALKATEPLEVEIERIKGLCEKSGLSIEIGQPGKDWVGEDYVFLKDPDGNIVELHEDGLFKIV